MKRPVLLAAAALTAVTLVAGCASDTDRENKPAGSAGTSTSPDASEEPEVVATPQPFNVSGLLGGNAKPTFPDGESGGVTVVAIGPLNKPGIGASLLLAFRNNTDEAVAHVGLSATARVDGKIVATGSSQGTTPSQIAPGEVSLAYIYFSTGEDIPDTGADYEFSSESSPSNTDSFNTADLTVDEANHTGKAIVGAATNRTGETVDGPYSVDVYCFNGNNITAHTRDYAEESGSIKAEGTVHFSVDLYDKPCDTFTVGVSGYFS